MAHFAEIDNNSIVIQVIKVDDEYENNFEEFSKLINLQGKWIKTSYNTVGGQHISGGIPLRKNYAAIGYSYDEQRDAFIPPKPFESWILNEETCLWEAPVSYPQDGGIYNWNEETVSWDLVITEDN